MALFPLRDRAHLSFRLNFAISAAVLVLWVLVLRDSVQTSGLMQRVLLMGGMAGVLLAPVIAGMGLSHALYGRTRWFVMLFALAVGGQGVFGGSGVIDQGTAFALAAIGALSAIYATFPRVFALLSLGLALNSLAQGQWPGFAAFMDAVLPLLRIGDVATEVGLALVFAALPFVTRALARRWT
jgi:hypothetical protein